MRKILKKVSASLILILMIFSVAFNVLTYAAGTITNPNNYKEIYSTYFKLIINQSTYEVMSQTEWERWLRNYDNYYSLLCNITGNNPSNQRYGYVTIDATLSSCSDSKVSNSPNSGWNGLTWANSISGYNIELIEGNFQNEISNIKNYIGTYESYTLLHEISHLFEYNSSANITNQSNIGSGPVESPVWNFDNEVNAMLQTNELIRSAGLSGIYNGSSFYQTDYDWYNYQGNPYGDYARKYELAVVLIELKQQTGLSSFTSVYNSIENNYNYNDYPQKLNTGSSERFNLFIDTMQKLTNQDAWQTLNNILNIHSMSTSTVSSIMADGGTIGTLKEELEDVKISNVTFQQIGNSKTGIYVKSIGNGAKVSIGIDGIQNISDFMSKVSNLSISLPGFTNVNYSVSGDKIVANLRIDTDNQLDTGKVNGDVIINYNEKEIEKSFSIEIVKDEEEDISISNITFKQIGNSKSGIYVKSIGNGAKVSIGIDGIQNINDFMSKVSNLGISLEGFILVNYSVSGDKIVANLRIDLDNQPDVEKTNGEIIITYDKKEIKKSFSIEIIEDEELNENITDIILRQGKKLIISGGKIVSAGEEGKLAYIDWNSNEKITLQFKLGTNETLNNNSVALTGYTATLISSENGQYEFEFEKDEIEPGTKEVTLSIKTNKNGSQNISGIPIKNTGDDTIIISRVHGEMKDDGRYFIYVNLDPDRDSKYDIDWCLENIKVILDDDSEISLSSAMKVTGTQDTIAFEVLNPTSEEVAGKTFEITVIAEENDDEIDSKEATIKIESSDFEEYNLIITNQDEISNAQNKYGDAYQYGTTTEKLSFNSGEEFWQTEFVDNPNIINNNSIFCAAKGKHMDFHGVLNFFNAVELTEISEVEKYALIYLNEMPDTIFTQDSSRYYALQAYIWTTHLNEGPTLPATEIQDEYVKYLEKAVEAAEEAVENGGILTLYDGRKIKIKSFSATYFEWEKSITSAGVEITYTEGSRQPFLTFDYELGEKPGIQLKKVNEQGEPVEATFTILKWNDEGKLTELPDGSEFTTNEEGLTDIISLKEGKYFIFETNVQGGYKPTKQYVILNVDKDGICKYEVEEAYDEALTADGYVALPSGTAPSGELDWNEISEEDDLDETEELDKVGELDEIEELDPSDDLEQIEELEKSKLILELTNKYEIPPIKIIKVDQDGNKIGGKGGSFQVTIRSRDGKGNLSKTYELNEKGEIDISLVEEEITGTELEITVEEIFAPEGYDKLENNTNTFSIKLSEDNEWEVLESVEDENFNVSVSNSLIQMKIRNNKKEEPPQEIKSGAQFPLLMSIQGKVWLDQPQGKNSEANGEYDSGDKLLKGITVKLYESDGVTEAKFADKNKVKDILSNQDNSKYLTSNLLKELQDKADKISSTNETKTDENGNFYFGGLDPDKKYTVKFEYNGMRYSEIMASIGVEGCGTPSSVQTTAKAIEDEERRKEITEMFKKIGPYPNNYTGGLVFTQTEVENYIQNKELPQGVSASQMQKFIEDTKITAEIREIGGILEEAENALLQHNSEQYPGIISNFKFPIVKKQSDRVISYDEGAGAVQEWIDSLKILEGSNNVGYTIQAIECYKKIQIEYGGHPDHKSTTQITPHVMYEGLYKSYIKGIENSGSVYVPSSNPGRCGWVPQKPAGVPGDQWNPTPCGAPVGVSISHEFHKNESKWACTKYYVDEGYSTGIEQDNDYWTRIAIFDINNEPLYDYDKTSGKKGIEDSKWGWIGLTNIDDNNITSQGGKEGLGKLYNMLVEKIKELEPKDQDLCVVYRPTVDLGLYDDVQKAIIEISDPQKGTRTNEYFYDKREANGQMFKFGVNEYDIVQNRNVKGNVEEAYADYYRSLSNGNPDAGENGVIQDIYEPLGERIEDIVINTEETNRDGKSSKTKDGYAVSGWNIDHNVKIEITYRIKVYNQSAVTSWVTDVLDYYSKDFSVKEVYDEKGNKLEYTDTTGTSTHNAININLENKQLNGNSHYEIYVVLTMNKPKQTLGGDVLKQGYTTYNYAEINGYRTNIGVIDIDSSPGDLRPEERFENGPYDDDESKSPALIFKNPDNASRTISGMVYEDETGKPNIVTGAERNGTGTIIPIAKAIVKLMEVDQTGKLISSGKEPNGETGLRGETLTKEDGTYTFSEILPGNYIVKFEYGSNYSTVLKQNLESGLNYQNLGERAVGRYLDPDNLTIPNKKSYNGQDYENTVKTLNNTNEYWYTKTTQGKSYAIDNAQRRNEVIKKSQTLTNHIAEVFNSYKDSRINYTLLNELIDNYSMYGETARMLLEVEYYDDYPEQVVNTKDDGDYEKTYKIGNVNFGIVERERAEIQITKKISKISIVNSSGTEITGGNAGEDIKYVKWIQGPDGFLDMEIDQELLSGATLIITYEITVTNTSEAGNTIENIQVIDYVSNNLNYDESYGDNKDKWKTITTEKAKEFVNNTSLNAKEDNTANKIDLSTYQTILMTEFDRIEPGLDKAKTKTLTLEKNLSAQEESDFNYENQVEIVQSYNENGRGDYSSIYGNLDPETYTSKQGDLFWDKTAKTIITLDDPVTGDTNAIREAEKDSGNAEEVIITPPTGAKGIVLQTYHYVLALIALITTAIGIIIIKKYIKIQK